MKPSEARGFLAGTNGRICVSFQVAPDGSMVTRSGWSALQNTWRAVRRGVFALLAMAAPVWFTACAKDKTGEYRTGGSTVITSDGKDSPPASKHHADGSRLTGETSRP